MQRLLRTTTVAALTAGLALASRTGRRRRPAGRGPGDRAPRVGRHRAGEHAGRDGPGRGRPRGPGHHRRAADPGRCACRRPRHRSAPHHRRGAEAARAGPLGGRRPDAGAGQDGRRRAAGTPAASTPAPRCSPSTSCSASSGQPHRHDPRGEGARGLRRRGGDRRDRQAGAGRAPRVAVPARGRVTAPGRGELRLGLPGPHAPAPTPTCRWRSSVKREATDVPTGRGSARSTYTTRTCPPRRWTRPSPEASSSAPGPRTPRLSCNGSSTSARPA